MSVDTNIQKIALTELANKLFMYCDAQQWDKLLDEVFTPTIWFDLSSAGGGEPQNMKAEDVCKMWEAGFVGLDAVHHQAGHYIISVHNDKADIYGYAVAAHYKKEAVKGNTRTFTGSYDLKAQLGSNGWRLTQFKYNLKYIDGNTSLE
ncbi:MAG: nuclear transport factor 2 family protein [Ferruginibacter sp.]